MDDSAEAPRDAGPAAHRRAIEAAYRALSRRERTEAELRTALERRGHAEGPIEAALDELRTAGYLDDAGYARRFADDRRRLDRWGAERIAHDLGRRGVAREHIEAALADADAEDELATACALLAERCPPPSDDRERARARGLLVRRGYASEVAYEAVRLHADRRLAGAPEKGISAGRAP